MRRYLLNWQRMLFTEDVYVCQCVSLGVPLTRAGFILQKRNLYMASETIWRLNSNAEFVVASLMWFPIYPNIKHGIRVLIYRLNPLPSKPHTHTLADPSHWFFYSRCISLLFSACWTECLHRIAETISFNCWIANMWGEKNATIERESQPIYSCNS